MTETEGAPPAMFEHCKTVYEKMMESATLEKLTDDVGVATTETGFHIYEGHTTQLFQALALPTPYYTTVMRLLRRMSCIEQTRRGGGNSKSKWRLVRPPTLEAFEAAQSIDKPRDGSMAAAQQQIRDLTNRVKRLEQAVGL